MDLSGYLIGGTIRDLVLDRPIKDIDIAINTNPESFLKRLSRKVLGHSICLDREFLTFRFMPKGQGQSNDQEQGRGQGQIKGQCRPSSAQYQYWFDFTPLKGDSIAQDLLKRDFTINAMAVDLKNLLNRDAPLCLIDPLGGISDLAKQTIRAISEKVFRDDPLRILRAYRFAGQLEFLIEDKTGELIQRDRDLVKNTAPERIREELFLILSLDKSISPFELLHQNGLFPILFSPALPCLPNLSGLPNLPELPKSLNLPRLPELPESEGEPSHEVSTGVWADALQILASVEEILLSLPIRDPDCIQIVQNVLSQAAGHQTTYKPLLKLAAFLSMLPHVWEQGKGEGERETEGGGEGERGRWGDVSLSRSPPAPPSQVRARENWNWLDSFLRWLCLSTPQRKYAIACIQGMQRPGKMIRGCCCTPRYFYRFFRDFGDAGIGALILSMAHQKAAKRCVTDDTKGFANATPGEIRTMGDLCDLSDLDDLSDLGDLDNLDDLFARMMGFYCDWRKNRQHPIMDGKFLLDYFHLSPGPIIGDILNLLEEARAEGEIQTREEAIDLARQLLPDHYHSK